tara:strand:- start:1262 stop:1474 length:213 start_codon:yes stop_codon:yes gene_type:complete
MDKTKYTFDKLIALLLMDMLKQHQSTENYQGEEEGDEKVGSIERDLAYEYQMDRVKVISGEHRDTQNEKE